MKYETAACTSQAHGFEVIAPGEICRCGFRMLLDREFHMVYVADGRCERCRFPIDDHKRGECPKVKA